MSEKSMWDTDCLRCDEVRSDAQLEAGDFSGSLSRRMIVCPECGNKRCPKATFHENPCGHSNESGQQGSDYAKFDPNAPMPTESFDRLMGTK